MATDFRQRRQAELDEGKIAMNKDAVRRYVLNLIDTREVPLGVLQVTYQDNVWKDTDVFITMLEQLKTEELIHLETKTVKGERMDVASLTMKGKSERELLNREHEAEQQD